MGIEAKDHCEYQQGCDDGYYVEIEMQNFLEESDARWWYAIRIGQRAVICFAADQRSQESQEGNAGEARGQIESLFHEETRGRTRPPEKCNFQCAEK